MRQPKYILSLLNWLAFVMLIASGCTEPYTPEIEGAADFLVVEGRITDDTSGSSFTLNRTFPFDATLAEKVTGAELAIETRTGQRHVLAETEEGLYRSDPSAFVPVRGEEYRLYIRLASGSTYASGYELMKSSPVIESVSWQPAEEEGDEPGMLRRGLEFRLTTEDPEGNSRFYRWSVDETWEFRVPYPISGTWTFEPTAEFTTFPPGTNTEVCYRFGKSSEILLGSTRQLVQDRIEQARILFVDARSGKLGYGYSALVKQDVLSEDEYAFYQTLRQNTETTGSIFDPVPSESRGNIHNLNDPEEIVLGYIGASSRQTIRLFVHPNDVPDEVGTLFQPYKSCMPDSLPLNYRTLSNRLSQGGYSFYDYVLNQMGFIVGFQVVTSTCGDCRLTGSPEKPSFWPW